MDISELTFNFGSSIRPEETVGYEFGSLADNVVDEVVAGFY